MAGLKMVRDRAGSRRGRKKLSEAGLPVGADGEAKELMNRWSAG